VERVAVNGPRILAIESSCDETGVAVVVGGRRIEANQVATQVALHAATGGIVPEVAARQQLRWIIPTLRAALDQAQVDWDDLDAVAVTYGPGLIGSLLVGVNVAKALAVAHGLPLVGVNHIEGHIYANWLTDVDADSPLPPEPEFPLLCLVVSGGHSQLALMHGHGRYELLGQTVDDAAGEAFDKVGRLLGLPYPGGPAISAAAGGATPATRFPRARTAGRYDFSFSGLKTAVLREVAGYRDRGEPIPVDGLAAAFEEAVVDALVTKTVEAARDHDVAAVALGGGVAANRSLRTVLAERLDDVPLLVPPPAWCTDNGAMIGAAAGFRYVAGDRADAALEAIPSLALPWLDATHVADAG
jgi:N6-L-threonylcarbamoyladenine synthase